MEVEAAALAAVEEEGSEEVVDEETCTMLVLALAEAEEVEWGKGFLLAAIRDL
jgi:hypothetical protein